VNWIGGAGGIDLPVRARIRSTGEPAQAALTLKDNGMAEIVLAEAEEGVSPGQACVFYAADSDRVLGGGWISSAKNT
jgi:tRNA-specific 2-thiouridylase